MVKIQRLMRLRAEYMVDSLALTEEQVVRYPLALAALVATEELLIQAGLMMGVGTLDMVAVAVAALEDIVGTAALAATTQTATTLPMELPEPLALEVVAAAAVVGLAMTIKILLSKTEHLPPAVGMVAGLG
jgi:hypothetical protein